MDRNDLTNKSVDYVVATTKAALSALPIIGSPLAELVGTVVPNQRMDRLAKFVAEIESRLSAVEQQDFQDRIHDPDFGELVEDAMRQAASSLTDERRQYLASIVAKALSPDEIELIDTRHLLRILQQINDVEVIVLCSYLEDLDAENGEFYARHADVLDPVAAYLDSDQRELDKEALYEGYRFHLSQLGLMSQEIIIDSKTKQPSFDSGKKKFKTSGYRLTALGRLLLRVIGVSADGFSRR